MTPTGSDHIAAPDLRRLTGALGASARRYGLDLEAHRRLLARWLDDAERLLLDHRGDPQSLLALVLAVDGRVLASVDRHPPATARMTAAVIAGWRDDGMTGAGTAATEPAGGWNDRVWDGEPAVDEWLYPLAVFHAAAAERLGISPDDARDWARCGIIDPRNAPEYPEVEDPTDSGQDFAYSVTDPYEDPNYRRLALWAGVGPGQAPLWFLAGYPAEEAAVLAALPDGDPRKPTVRELALRAVPRGPRSGLG